MKVARLTLGGLAICYYRLTSLRGDGMECQQSAEGIVDWVTTNQRAEPADKIESLYSECSEQKLLWRV